MSEETVNLVIGVIVVLVCFAFAIVLGHIMYERFPIVWGMLTEVPQ